MKVQQVSPGIINKIKSLIARVGYMKSDIGIVEDTDTATHTISSGQYVIWKNELYKASAAIPSGDPLSSTNLTAVSDGIANELNSKMANFIKSKSLTGTTDNTGDINIGLTKDEQIPFLYQSKDGSANMCSMQFLTYQGQTWYGKAIKDNNQPLASTAISGTLYYFEIG